MLVFVTFVPYMSIEKGAHHSPTSEFLLRCDSSGPAGTINAYVCGFTLRANPARDVLMLHRSQVPPVRPKGGRFWPTANRRSSYQICLVTAWNI
jgi:hypothetical protein